MERLQDGSRKRDHSNPQVSRMKSRIPVVIASALIASACTVKLPGMRDPGVEIARIMAEAQVKTVESITAMMTKAQASACEVVK